MIAIFVAVARSNAGIVVFLLLYAVATVDPAVHRKAVACLSVHMSFHPCVRQASWPAGRPSSQDSIMPSHLPDPCELCTPDRMRRLAVSSARMISRYATSMPDLRAILRSVGRSARSELKPRLQQRSAVASRLEVTTTYPYPDPSPRLPPFTRKRFLKQTKFCARNRYSRRRAPVAETRCKRRELPFREQNNQSEHCDRTCCCKVRNSSCGNIYGCSETECGRAPYFLEQLISWLT